MSEVARIVAIGNRVIRNLEITECYAQLSDAMRERTGAAPTWCTFATWASRQAGSTIRGEDLLDRWKRRLGPRARLLAPIQSITRALLRRGLFEPETRLGRVVAAIHSPFDAFERASDAVAIGNLKVFEEIGLQFARFLATVPPDADEQSEAFRSFAAELSPGPPPDGQDYLRDAFAHYQRQTSNDALRACWILLANLEIGLHEQTRLQSQITAAVDAPLVTAADLGARVLNVLAPYTRRWPNGVRRPAALAIGGPAVALRRAAITVTREIVTESMMVLALPTGVLALGRHLDAPAPAVFSSPPPAELAAFLSSYDPCTSERTNCGADDWCDLRQRMHYIVHLFKAYAEDRALFARPFTPEQVAGFRAGLVPAGDV